jgi:hypothetical protein
MKKIMMLLMFTSEKCQKDSFKSPFSADIVYTELVLIFFREKLLFKIPYFNLVIKYV